LLVPDAFDQWEISKTGAANPPRIRYFAQVGRDDGCTRCDNAATPALALCIAALMAPGAAAAE